MRHLGDFPKLDPHRCRVCGATGQSQTSVLTAWFNNAAIAATSRKPPCVSTSTCSGIAMPPAAARQVIHIETELVHTWIVADHILGKGAAITPTEATGFHGRTIEVTAAGFTTLPSTTVPVPRLASDLYVHCLEAAAGRIETDVELADDACVGIALATEGYPPAPIRKGDVIEGLDAASALPA